MKISLGAANNKDWENFNKTLHKKIPVRDLTNPHKITDSIIWALNKTIGKKTIGNSKIKESKEVKQARRAKRQARNLFDTACKNNGNKTQTLENYREAQTYLKSIILKEKKEETKSTFDKILNEGGVKSQTFWQTRRKILGANKPPEYDTIDEQGVKILDPEKSKEHIASYFEQLYRAREPDKTNYEISQKISNDILEWEKKEEYNQPQAPIT